MANGITRTLAALRKEVGELRAEVAELRDEVGEGVGELLHRDDVSRRCLRVILRMVKHLHSEMAARKMRDTARGNRR
jgi:hypothetical protein